MRTKGLFAGVLAVTIAGIGLTGLAQNGASDPRVGLKPGFQNAGTAARHMQLIAHLPRPDGFYDPKNPAGTPTPPERDPNAPAATPAPASGAAPASGPAPAPGAASAPAATPAAAAGPSDAAPAANGGSNAAPPAPSALNFANSDLAFGANRAVMGNFHGFTAYDVENPSKPRLIASIVCPGGQGDVSIYGRLLFMSVEQTRGRLDCGVSGVAERISAERFRGVRIFDISDIANPKQIADVQTCRGSHTHTLVVDPTDRQNVYIYGSGTGAVRAAEELGGCSGGKPEEDANTALFSIDVIQVPLDAPERAAVVNRPRIFQDTQSGAIAGLWLGGDHGPGTQRTSTTNQCHDITVFPEIGLAAGACSGNGILLDITDPVHPVRLDAVSDNAFAYWHSATFNNDGTKVIFTDEWGGGTRPRCRATDPPTWGADAIFDIVDRKLKFAGYYKLPAPQSDQENCVAHNGSLIPIPGRDIMVQAWYQGGLSVFDFTDSAHPVEIAFFDRGPLDGKTLITGGYWSTYWFNGNIYASEIARGLDVFKLLPSEHLSQNEIAVATLMRFDEFNPQRQTRIQWPATSLVARAYLDQLTRSKTIAVARARTVSDALERVDKLRDRTSADAQAARSRLATLAAEFERDAATASAIDARRMKGLADTLRARGEG